MISSDCRFDEYDQEDVGVGSRSTPKAAEIAKTEVDAVHHFDEARALEELAARIKESHAACQATFQSSVQRAKEAGELLIRVKGSLAHGEFGRWVVAQCLFSPETARGYMRVARRWQELESADPERQRVTDFSYRAALAQLAKPRSNGSDSKDRSAKTDEREHDSARSGPAADASGPNNSPRSRVIEIEEDEDEWGDPTARSTSTSEAVSYDVSPTSREVAQTGHAESVAIGEPSVSPAEGSEEQVGTASDRPTWDLETLQAMMIPILRDIYDYRRDEWLATAQAQGTDLETMAAVEIAAAILQL